MKGIRLHFETRRAAVSTPATTIRRSLVASLLFVVIFVGEGPASASEPPAGEAARVQGRVIDELGNLLVGARITVAVPQVDMRHVYPGSGHRTYTGRTDDKGRYDIHIDLQGERSVGVDAVAPGYRSAAGTFMSGGDRRGAAIEPGGVYSASFVLEKGTYFAGTVVDADGTPLADVGVSAYDCSQKSCGGISDTTTDREGRFEVFNFPLRFREGRKGVLYFQHAAHAPMQINDVTQLAPSEWPKLRVVMYKGRAMSGRIVNATGKAVVGAIVEAVSEDPPDLPLCLGAPRRSMLSDADGRFAFRGIPNLPTTVRVVSFATRQRMRTVFPLNRAAENVELQLAPIAPLKQTKVVTWSGMKLASVTSEVRAAYLLEDWSDGVVVVDPGREAARLGLLDLREGDVLFRIGARHASVKSIDGLIAAIEKELQEPSEGRSTAIPITYLRPSAMSNSS